MAAPCKIFVFPRGFTIVEMLVVIAIIGILSAVALPSLSNLAGKSTEAQSTRNAQNLATSYSAALVAGHDFAQGETNASDVVRNIVAGTTITLGPGSAIFVGVPGLSGEAQTAALPFLEILQGHLTYKPN